MFDKDIINQSRPQNPIIKLVGFFYAFVIFINKVKVMEKENFIKWFIRKGWKSYTFPIVIGLSLNYGIFLSDGGAKEMFADPDIPIAIWVLTFIAYFGFHIGITWHMIDAFKKQRL